MRTTTYKCDRCGVSWSDGDKPEERLHVVSFGVGSVTNGWQLGATTFLRGNKAGPKLQAEWCRSCLVEIIGWVPAEDDPRPDAQQPEVAPSLEDIVRSIVRAELDEHNAP